MLLTTLLLALAPNHDPAPELAGLPERWLDAMEALHVPGAAFVVVRDGEVVLLEGLGLRDVQTDAPVTPDSAFYIASCTKPFVAFAVARLAEEGRVELDAPVTRYLPRFELAEPGAAEAITVRQLLCHEPGLGGGPVVFLDAYSGEITEERYYGWLAEEGRGGAPDYSNVHYTLLGRVVEAVTGKGWRDHLRASLFEPAGMTRTTGFADEMYARDDVAIPALLLDGDWTRSPVRKTDRTMHAAGGLGASARDLGRWLLLNIGLGVVDGVELLGEDAAYEMQALQCELPRAEEGHATRRGFGLGWMVGAWRDHLRLSHGGGYVGAAAHVSFLPEERLGVAVVANTDRGGHELCRVVEEDVYSRLLGYEAAELLLELVPGVERQLARRDEARPPGEPPRHGAGLTLEPARYAGRYANPRWGTVRVEARGAGLWLAIGDLEPELLTRGPDRFLAWLPGGLEDAARFVVEDGEVRAFLLEPGGGRVARFDRE